MDEPRRRVEVRVAELRDLLPPGTDLDSLGDGRPGAHVVDVTHRGDDVILRFRWVDDPHVFSSVVAPPTDDLDDPMTDLDERLGTGLVARAARRRDGSDIELFEPGWPDDQRFYLSGVHPELDEDAYTRQAIDFFEADGFSAATVRALQADGTLISWQRIYLNNRIGLPFVGHAAVAAVDSDTARLMFCETRPDVPETAAVDLCLAAAHEASWSGARRVITDLDEPVTLQALAIIGFRDGGPGLVLDTDFLDADHHAYARLLQTTRRFFPSRDPRARIRAHRQSPYLLRVGT